MDKGRIITELEGLEILKSYGLSNGEEETKAYYMKNGCINTGKPLKAYLEKLEQVHTYAKLIINENTGKPLPGTRRLIELGEIRESISDRYDGRVNNSRPEDENNNTIYMYLFNRLLEMREDKPFPYRTWASKVGLFDTSELNNKKFIKHMETTISNLHLNTLGHDKETTNEIIREFKEMLYKRNNDIIENGFIRLERLGKIKITDNYFSRLVDDAYERITEEKYEQLCNEENMILDDCKMDKGNYVSMKMYPVKRNDAYYDAYGKVTEHMKAKHGIRYYFISKSISILDKVKYDDIDELDMKIAYKNKLLELTVSRMNRADYKDTGELSKRWYVINTFTLLKEMRIDIPKDLYSRYKKKLDKDHSENVVKNKQLQDDIDAACDMF